MSSDKNRRNPSRAWLGVAAITIGVGTVLTPGVAHAEPSTPGNPSGSGSSGASGTAGEPKPNNSTTAEEHINHPGTTGRTGCERNKEECIKPGEALGAVPGENGAGIKPGETHVTEHSVTTAPSAGPTVGSHGDSTATAGQGMELSVIAAVVIGGTPVRGGAGSVLGVFLGCVLLGAINVALAVLGIAETWQVLIYGIVILVAVIVDAAVRRIAERRTLGAA